MGMLKAGCAASVSMVLIAAVGCSTRSYDAQTSGTPVWRPFGEGGLVYTSAELVTKNASQWMKIQPQINPAKVPGGVVSAYLSKDSALGYYGPMGPYGALGDLGAINLQSSQLVPGVHTIDGPLGANGALAPAQYLGMNNPGKKLFEENDFAVHTRAFGLWAPLGPLAALGPVGPLGALGSFGGHGFERSENGDFLKGGKVVRSIQVPLSTNMVRSYDLVETYPQEIAVKKKDNDTSFVVVGSATDKNWKSFPVKTNAAGIMTVTAVPGKQLDNFDIRVLDRAGKVIASSATFEFIDWIQMEVPAGAEMKVEIKLTDSFQWASSTYHLVVTTAPSDISVSNVQGPHIHKWYN